MAQNKAQTAKGRSGKAEDAAPKVKKKKVGPFTFIQQVRAEGSKVTWTSRAETIAATIMVLIMTVIISIFLLTVDQVVGWVVRLITGIGS